MLIAVIVAGLARLLGAIVIFNRLVAERSPMRVACSDIDTQLMLRHELIPPLISAARAGVGHARHEDALGRRIERLQFVQESHRDLNTADNVLPLQRDPVAIEDHLQYARRHYNAAVRQPNTRIEHFPDLTVARLAGFQRGEFFEANTQTRSPP
jgi:LemA protein